MSLKPKKASKLRGREQCNATTKAGRPCQAPAVEGGLCFCHAHPEKLAELGRQGGKKNRRWKGDGNDLPTIPLKSIDDLVALLGETINRVRQGPFDLRAANTIGFLAGILGKAIAQRVEEPPQDSSANIYTSLFERLRTEASEQEARLLYRQRPQQDETFPLYPELHEEDVVIAPLPLPAPGESIDDPPTPPNDHPNIVTVEIG